jgi:hypothetical protein
MVKIAHYDLQKCPASFDFTIFLSVASSYGCTHVRFSHYGEWKRKDYSDPEMRVKTILEPMCALIGMDYSFGEPEGTEYGYMYSDINRAFKENGRVGKIKSLLPPKEGDYVTFTIRNSERRQDRNTNIIEWEDFFDGKGWNVVYIKDYSDQPIHLHDRIALYAGARVNFFGHTGCSQLCMISDFPYLMVLQHNDRTEKMWLDHGMYKDRQLPFANRNQRIYWGRENEIFISSAYKRWCSEQ